jgi:glucose dehydrogenase
MSSTTRDRRFRAFDSATGRELWVDLLDGNANANPMTYRSGAGRQHVAIVVGDLVQSYALP